MKKLMIFALVMSITSLVCADAYQAGGDRLAALQNNDGGWDWPLDNGNPATGSASNTIGPIAMGLAQAYKQTGSASQLAALQKAGDFLLSKTVFSPSDGYIAVELDNVFGTTAYTSYVKTNFYDKLAAGTYERSGVLYDTAGYVDRIRTSRSGSQANLAAWDIGMGLYAADLIGADTAAWLSATQAEIDELDSDNYYDVIGLAGAVFGLASAGYDYNPTAGAHAAASSIADLAAILAGYQLSTGGFTWNAGYVTDGENNESIQETAYALLALNAVDSTAYVSQLLAGGNYINGAQLGTGGWEGYIGSGENNEITGEALWALSIPEPATMVLLGLGGLLCRRFKRA